MERENRLAININAKKVEDKMRLLSKGNVDLQKIEKEKELLGKNAKSTKHHKRKGNEMHLFHL